MPIIRHDIPLTVHTMTGTAVSSDEEVILDTTKFSGSCTYFFEIDAAAGASALTINLKIDDGATNPTEASIVTSTTTDHQKRVQFTPTSSLTNYWVSTSSAASGTVLATRIVIIQNTGSSPILNSQDQYQIVTYELTKTNTTLAAQTDPIYWYYDSNLYDGSCTFQVTVVWAASSASQAKTITLQEDDGGFGAWSNNVTLVNAASTTAYTVTTVTFTPKHGRNYRIASFISTNASNYSLYCGTIKVIQVSTTGIKRLVCPYHSSINVQTGGTTDRIFLFDSGSWSGVNIDYIPEHSAEFTNSKSVFSGQNTNAWLPNGVTSGCFLVRGGMNQWVIHNSKTGFIEGGTGFSAAAAQSFVANTGLGIIGFRLNLGKEGSPTDGVFVEVGTGSISDSIIATSQTITGISGILGNYNFYFSSGVGITGNQSGFFRVRRTGDFDSVNRYGVGLISGGTYTSGNYYQLSGNGSNWLTNGSGDIGFVLLSKMLISFQTGEINSAVLTA